MLRKAVSADAANRTPLRSREAGCMSFRLSAQTGDSLTGVIRWMIAPDFCARISETGGSGCVSVVNMSFRFHILVILTMKNA